MPKRSKKQMGGGKRQRTTGVTKKATTRRSQGFRKAVMSDGAELKESTQFLPTVDIGSDPNLVVPLPFGGHSATESTLCFAPTGTAYDRRIGRQITLKKLHFKMQLWHSDPAAQYAGHVRLMIIQDRFTNLQGVEPNILTQVLSTNMATGTNPGFDEGHLLFKQLGNARRYRVWYDKTHTLRPYQATGGTGAPGYIVPPTAGGANPGHTVPADSPQTRQVQTKLVTINLNNINVTTTYGSEASLGTADNISDNNFFMVAVGSESGHAPKIKGICRARFVG